jgi:hypothetical protein
MRSFRIPGLAVIATIAAMLLIGAGTASAGGVFCELQEVGKCPALSKWNVNTILDFELEAGTKAELLNSENKPMVSCAASTLETELTSNPDAGGEATGRNAAWNWGNGVTPCETKTLELGKLKFANIAGTFNATVRADALIEFTAETALNGKCIYLIESGTDIGELKEGKVELGSTSPTLKISATATKKTTKEDGCVGGPATAKLVASYVLMLPVKTTLAVTES